MYSKSRHLIITCFSVVSVTTNMIAVCRTPGACCQKSRVIHRVLARNHLCHARNLANCSLGRQTVVPLCPKTHNCLKTCIKRHGCNKAKHHFKRCLTLCCKRAHHPMPSFHKFHHRHNQSFHRNCWHHRHNRR